MLTRIVKMHFHTEKVADFLAHFETIKDKVRNQPGCRSMHLYQDAQNPDIYFTISLWDQESDLEHYRTSPFFKEVWYYTKSLFQEKAEAWTLEKLGV
jgi:autoinducer 2-degrading protein